MNRRFVAFLMMLAIGLQGPGLAYASAAAVKTMPPACAGHTFDQGGHVNCPCCPQERAPGVCCTGVSVFTGTPSGLVVSRISPIYRIPAAAGFVAFATERPIPLLRPPIA